MNILKDTNFRVILAVIAMGVMGGSIVGPILPAMIGPLGVSGSSIGWVLSIYTFFAMASTPILGVIADRKGRKKVMIPSTLLFGLAGISIPFTTSFGIILTLRALQGICVAGMLSIGVTLIGDLYSGVDRSKAMGYRVSVQNFINAIMPFAAGALATLAWFYPFFIYSLSLLIGTLLIFKLRLNEKKAETSLGDYFRAGGAVIKNSKILWVFFSNLMAFIFLYCIVVYMPLVVTQKLGFSTVFTGLAISIGSGSAGIFASQTPKLRKLLKDHILVATGFALAGIALFTMGAAEDISAVLLPMGIWGAGFSLIMPVITTIATEETPFHLRAGIMAVFSMMIYLGQTVSPPLFGLVLGMSNLTTVFTVAALTTLIPISYALIEMKHEKSS